MCGDFKLFNCEKRNLKLIRLLCESVKWLEIKDKLENVGCGFLLLILEDILNV